MHGLGDMENPTAVIPSATPRTGATLAPTPELEPAPSKAAIAGHPIHPMLIPFPLALLSLVPVTDIVYTVTEAMFWATASYYLLWAGLISAGVAAIFGLVDFIGVKRVRRVRAGWAHMLLNMIVVALSIVNLLLRHTDAIDIVPSGLILSIVATSLLLVSGWYGGELVYRYKVGMTR
jgi:uncharacterized membrane protein